MPAYEVILSVEIEADDEYGAIEAAQEALQTQTMLVKVREAVGEPATADIDGPYYEISGAIHQRTYRESVLAKHGKGV